MPPEEKTGDQNPLRIDVEAFHQVLAQRIEVGEFIDAYECIFARRTRQVPVVAGRLGGSEHQAESGGQIR